MGLFAHLFGVMFQIETKVTKTGFVNHHQDSKRLNQFGASLRDKGKCFHQRGPETRPY